MRVLVDGVIYGLQSRGGVSRYFTETLSRIGLCSDTVQIFLDVPALCEAELPNAEWIEEIRRDSSRLSRIAPRLSGMLGMARMRAIRPQIFHSTYYTQPYWPALKSVVTVYDFIDERYPALMAGNERFVPQKKRAIENADAIVAISDSTKDDILKFTRADESKITVIPCGVSECFSCSSPSETDIEACQVSHGITNPYWLYVGKRALYKNFGVLLRAFVQLAGELDGGLVLVGGESRLEPWQVDLLIEHGLETRVRMLRDIDDNNLRLAYSGAAAVIVPSLAEGFGIPVLEAMACGTPVVASDIPVFREIAGDAAVYFDPHDMHALACAMKDVLNETVRSRLVPLGCERATRFSWDRSAEQLAEVYRSLS